MLVAKLLSLNHFGSVLGAPSMIFKLEQIVFTRFLELFH